jgi:hypothetical protein
VERMGAATAAQMYIVYWGHNSMLRIEVISKHFCLLEGRWHNCSPSPCPSPPSKQSVYPAADLAAAGVPMPVSTCTRNEAWALKVCGCSRAQGA